MTIAHAVANVIGQHPMARSEVVVFLQNGTGMTEERANEVIAYGLDHSLLVKDPTDATRLQGTPKPYPRP